MSAGTVPPIAAATELARIAGHLTLLALDDPTPHAAPARPVGARIDEVAPVRYVCWCGRSHEGFRWHRADVWEVDGAVYNAEGFEQCFGDDCGEALGSPWCCDQRPIVVQSYRMQYDYLDRVRAPRAERTLAQIIVDCPVNVAARGRAA